MTTLIPKYHAFTKAQLLAAPAWGGGGASLPEPVEGYGLNFTNTDSANNERIYASIQGETKDNTAGANNGRLNVLISDGDFLQVVTTWDNNGALITGPGAAPYSMEIAGEQTISSVPPYGALFGERLSVQDPDYEDSRPLAVRNLRISDLTSLTERVGMGFSMMDSAGKECATGLIRTQFTSRTAGSQTTFMYPSTYLAGNEIDGPFFYNGGIGFEPTALAANQLKDYEVGTWTPVFSGSTGGSLTGTWDTGPTGSYVIIGKTVFISFYGAMNSPTGYPTGQVVVSGLPFAIKYGATGNYQSITPSYTDYGTAPTSVTTRWQSSGTTQLLLYSGTNWGSTGTIELGGSGVLEIA